ncbi:Uncharacterised protein [Serratia fonticola]|uniref:Uncharacterized protein n=1 Tax=Serratia fonticola TaxID=47917 RepID=A0A448S7X1_SERFO|nr:Uncharacterised protein [Serratia fonticola]
MEISDEIHALCQRYQALALSEDEQRLTIALHGEIPAALVSALRFATGKSVGIEQWPVARLEQAQNQRQSLVLVPPPENTEERPLRLTTIATRRWCNLLIKHCVAPFNGVPLTCILNLISSDSASDSGLTECCRQSPLHPFLWRPGSLPG